MVLCLLIVYSQFSKHDIRYLKYENSSFFTRDLSLGHLSCTIDFTLRCMLQKQGCAFCEKKTDRGLT